MDAKELFARNLNLLLSLSQMTQSDLADRLGVSKTAVSSWCSGAKAPRMDKVDAMANIFGVTRSAFYAESPPQFTVVDARGDELKRIFYKLTDAAQEKVVNYAIDLWNNPENRK